ncbi:hypothetical protein [Cellvibrio polysaccharolyticus]|nr:hypothetical protein [Cellvibrio polysaccharolyticus]
MIELISSVVAPKIQTDDSEDLLSSITVFFQDMRDYDMPQLEAEVAFLHLLQNQEESIFDQIEDALLSDSTHIKRDALRALSRLFQLTFDGNSSIPCKAISILEQYIAWCSTSSITSAFSIIPLVLKNYPNLFSGALERRTLNRLTRTLRDTSHDNSASNLNFDESLAIRHRSSGVAMRLWNFYSLQKRSVPPIVESWRHQALSPDEFSEVRNQWVNGEINVFP